MVTVNVDSVPEDFWNMLEEYDGESEYLQGVVDGAGLEPIARLEDAWGWDNVYRLNDRTIVADDRNSGQPSILTDDQYAELLSYEE